jgi:hypothetical protein
MCRTSDLIMAMSRRMIALRDHERSLLLADTQRQRRTYEALRMATNEVMRLEMCR